MCTNRSKGDASVPVHPQVQTLLDLLIAAGGPPLTEQTPEAARAMFRAMSAMNPPGETVASVEDRAIPGPAGELPVRIYRPDGDGPFPGLVWFHGGGWVIGDLDTGDSSLRALCNRAGVVIVSIDYRLAPEHRFPAPADDCFAATRWVAEHAADLGIDAARLAVGGDSAGGNLAAATTLRCRDEGGPALAFQLLVYPVTDCTLTQPSHVENAEGYLLTHASMGWFVDHYLGDADAKEPIASPLHADDLNGLPPALIFTAEFDPLRDEGEAYAARLAEAGVAVDQVRVDGQIHGFWGMLGILDDAAVAIDRAGGALRAAVA
jgi:acetyl esterase